MTSKEPREWTPLDSREAFVSKEAPDAFDVFCEAMPKRTPPTLRDFIEWAQTNNLRGATAALYFLSEIADDAGLFETHADNMNDPRGNKQNPWLTK